MPQRLQLGVKDYWSRWPDANIAIVIPDDHFVLDVDAEHGGYDSLNAIQELYNKLPDTMSAITGGGGLHLWFKAKDIRNTTALAGFSGLDIRGIGGYVVAPPSIHPSGNVYSWRSQNSVADTPDWLLALCSKKRQLDLNNLTLDQGVPIQQGQRNQTLISEAGSMRRRGMGEDAIAAALLTDNRARCNPPLPENEVQTIAKSVCRYSASDNGNKDIYHYCPPTDPAASNRDKTVIGSVTKPLSEKIEDWVIQTTGWFSYEECDKEIGIRDTPEKDNRRHVFMRLKAAGKVEAHPKNNKLYRYINTSVRLIDFKSGTKVTPIQLKYPFGIEYYFNTYPGNIIVVAGSPDSGKTAFLLNVIKLNQYDFSIYYQSSEMGRDELQNRLLNFDGIGLDDWNFTAEERSSNFADVIRPNCINIIDYMELSGDFYMVAEYLRQIHDKLDGGIAIVALQKDPKAPQGRGGTFGLEKPRLYLNMDSGKTVIKKAKNWTHPEQNPNGLTLNYKIVGGCKFIITNDWHTED